MGSVAAQPVEETRWSKGVPLGDDLLSQAVHDVWLASVRLGGTVEGIRPLPRDVDAARQTVEDAAGLIVAAIERRPSGETDAAARLLVELRRVADRVAEISVTYRVRATEKVYRAPARLRHCDSLRDLYAHAVVELCRCGFDRAMLTRVIGATGVVEAFHDLGDQDRAAEVLEWARATSLPLDRLGRETQMIRRRTPLLVTDTSGADPLVHPFRGLPDCRAYVAAPVIEDGRLVALLHADSPRQRRLVDEFDRDLLAMFADGFARVYERRSLLDQLRSVQNQVRRAEASVLAMMREQAEAPIELVAVDDDPLLFGSAASMFSSSETDPSSLLTRRELDVMRRVVAGATNGQIAAELFLSEQTVRSHVKRILRKLRASNRAEAVARWTALTG